MGAARISEPPPNALQRGRALLTRRVPMLPAPRGIDRRSWHYDAAAIEALCDYLDETDPMGGSEGDPTSPFVRRLTVHATPWRWNDERDEMLRASMLRRGLDPDSREDLYDDYAETVAP